MEKKEKCNAKVHTQGTEIVKRTNEHLHAPDKQAVSCYETKIDIKRKARDSQDTSHQIVGECYYVSEGTAAKLPKLDSLKRTIQLQRVLQLAAPVQTTSLKQLALPPENQQTAKEEQFLLYDTGPEKQRMLIFGTQRTSRCCHYPTTGWLMAPSRRYLLSSPRCTRCMHSGEHLSL